MERDIAHKPNTRQETAKSPLNAGWTLSSLDFDQLYFLWLERKAVVETERGGKPSEDKRHQELMEVIEEIAKRRSKTLKDLAIKVLVAKSSNEHDGSSVAVSIHKDALIALSDIQATAGAIGTSFGSCPSHPQYIHLVIFKARPVHC